MKSLRIIRKLKLKNIELYKIKMDGQTRTISYMIVVDFKRKSTVEDCSYLKEIDEKDFKGGNYVKVIFIHDMQITEGLNDELIKIAEGLISNIKDCDFTYSFKKIKTIRINKMDNNQEYCFEYVGEVLQEFEYTHGLEKIDDEKFNFLSQD